MEIDKLTIAALADGADKKMMEAAEKCVEALDAADRAGDEIATIEPSPLRIELDEDDQAEEGPANYQKKRIILRFPVYVRHLLGRGIHNRHGEIFPFIVENDHLDRFTDDELAAFADDLADNLPKTLSTTPASNQRKRAYFRILAVALRHFQDDPAAVRAAIAVVGMVARGRKAPK